MRAHNADNAEEAIAALLAGLAPIVSTARTRADTLDRAGKYPADDVAALTRAGALRAVLPTLMGGLGLGTEPSRALATASLLHLIGGASIALGRILEAHINALRLVMRHGTKPLRQTAADDARAGHLHALWVTDGAAPLEYAQHADGLLLHGEKRFCSAAGRATRAVVTAVDARGDSRMLLLPLGQGETIRYDAHHLQGVRSAGTATVGFDNVRCPMDALLGPPGAYLLEPEFSAGAWRASAVTTGALSSLVEATRQELVARGRAQQPEQRERLGRMFINAQTALLWLRHVAPIAEQAEGDPDAAAATTNLARIAIEAVCVDTMQLAQRCLGLSAFLQGNPVERMCRDLGTYLRQPAPDEALSDAATYFTAHGAGGHLP
jgi:hypothetical protein